MSWCCTWWVFMCMREHYLRTQSIVTKRTKEKKKKHISRKTFERETHNTRNRFLRSSSIKSKGEKKKSSSNVRNERKDKNKTQYWIESYSLCNYTDAAASISFCSKIFLTLIVRGVRTVCIYVRPDCVRVWVRVWVRVCTVILIAISIALHVCVCACVCVSARDGPQSVWVRAPNASYSHSFCIRYWIFTLQIEWSSERCDNQHTK